ncbi:hypothetical protein N9F34_02000 [Alphaproteobacteria bacterium]|nr:hypothetical protein [Alphaproteobacteria bacterium]
MSAEQRLKNLGIVLPVASAPAGSYAKVVMLDGFAHLSGQGPRNADGSPMTGQVPIDRSVEGGPLRRLATSGFKLWRCFASPSVRWTGWPR